MVFDASLLVSGCSFLLSLGAFLYAFRVTHYELTLKALELRIAAAELRSAESLTKVEAVRGENAALLARFSALSWRGAPRPSHRGMTSPEEEEGV